MPELPDVELYRHALEARVLGEPLTRIRLASPFLLRTVTPSPSQLEGLRVEAIRRIGKRLVFAFENELFAVLHLMIAGRLRWRAAGTAIPKRRGLAAFDFPAGTVLLTEAGTKKRASLHLVRGEDELSRHDPGGVEPLTAELDDLRAALTRENHTLKRALTDPRILSGIGNAYSDEILHRAHMSPFRRTADLTEAEIDHLLKTAREVLAEWSDRLRHETGENFPEKVTAFRPDMAVHGKHRQPCPTCGTAVQRIVYAQNEANYCPTCQTGGRLLADRALSRLLKADWPKTIEELERRQTRRIDTAGKA